MQHSLSYSASIYVTLHAKLSINVGVCKSGSCTIWPAETHSSDPEVSERKNIAGETQGFIENALIQAILMQTRGNYRTAPVILCNFFSGDRFTSFVELCATESHATFH